MRRGQKDAAVNEWREQSKREVRQVNRRHDDLDPVKLERFAFFVVLLGIGALWVLWWVA